MSRSFVRVLLVIGALFLLACLGQAVPFQFAFFVACGWMFYLYRAMPLVKVDGPAVATALTCLVLLTAGLHAFAGWLYSQVQGSIERDRSTVRHWPARWTIWMVGSVLLMFVAGLATVGVTHQTAWLLFTSEKLVVSNGSGAARRAQSTNNLKQIGMGLSFYEQEHGAFPPGCSLDAIGRPLHGWQAMILPYLDDQDLYDLIDFQAPWNDPRNSAHYQTVIRTYLIPGIDAEKDSAGFALSHYAGSALMLGGDVPKGLRNVSDGAANTIMAGSVAGEFKPWGDPTNWRELGLGINQSPHGFGGPFPGGASFLMADGSVRFLKNGVAPQILKALGTPSGGEKVSNDEY